MERGNVIKSRSERDDRTVCNGQYHALIQMQSIVLFYPTMNIKLAVFFIDIMVSSNSMRFSQLI